MTSIILNSLWAIQRIFIKFWFSEYLVGITNVLRQRKVVSCIPQKENDFKTGKRSCHSRQNVTWDRHIYRLDENLFKKHIKFFLVDNIWDDHTKRKCLWNVRYFWFFSFIWNGLSIILYLLNCCIYNLGSRWEC